MEALQNKKRDELVYEQLLDNIKTGVWKEGDKLPSEHELCLTLKVSRGTVRSAVQKLASIGLVESKHGLGTFVCHNDDLFDFSGFDGQFEMTPEEFQDIAELREAIEQKAVQTISETGKFLEKDELKESFQHMVEAAKEFDVDTLTKYDMRFHMAIILSSRNRLFVQIMRIFHDQYYTMLLETNKLMLRDFPDKEKVSAHFKECIENHRHLMDALLSKPVTALREQNRFHERNKERIDYFFARKTEGGKSDNNH